MWGKLFIGVYMGIGYISGSVLTVRLAAAEVSAMCFVPEATERELALEFQQILM